MAAVNGKLAKKWKKWRGSQMDLRVSRADCNRRLGHLQQGAFSDVQEAFAWRTCEITGTRVDDGKCHGRGCEPDDCLHEPGGDRTSEGSGSRYPHGPAPLQRRDADR